MYARQISDGRLTRGVNVPRNYSGNAFRASEMKSEEQMLEISKESKISEITEGEERQERLSDLPDEGAQETKAEETENSPSAPVGRLLGAPGFRLDMSRFLKRGNSLGLGFEEFLIIGLIFLISGGEQKDDLIFLLLLLLFIE